MTTPDQELAVKALRPLIAWGLLAYVAVTGFFALLTWLVPTGGSDIFGRSWNANDAVTGLVLISLPVLAVLIAKGSKLIAFVALAEYAFIVLFGLLTFLIGLLHTGDIIHDAPSAFNSFAAILLDVIRLGLAALAALLTFRIFTALGGKITVP